MSEIKWDKHRQAVERNYEVFEGKRALLQTWKEKGCDDVEYLRDLTRRVRSLQVRCMAMKPVGDLRRGMKWVFTFRVEPPPGVISARYFLDGSVCFAAYSRLIDQWYLVANGTEEIIEPPDMIFVDEQWANEHKRDLGPPRIKTGLRRSKKPVQLQLL